MPKVHIEIYRKDTGEVVDTKTFANQRACDAFEYYFEHQCDTESFSWRVVKTGT